MKPYLYDKAVLPENFSFPQSYIEFVSQDEIPYLEPWWFLSEFEEDANFWLNEIKKQYPSRNLVPFAKYDTADDMVCFDGSDTSGNPKVFYVHTFASPGWEDRGEVENFDVWLEKTRAESAQYKSEIMDDE
jgi:hypothetical protein